MIRSSLTILNLLAISASSFLVDDVQRATLPYKSAKSVSETFASHSSNDRILPEAFSTECLGNKTLLQTTGINGFVETVHIAYANHYPLEISPDDIWLCIAQGFAAHVNANAEKLRHFFVKHEGKEELSVRRDEFEKGSPNNMWPDVFSNFSAQIRSHIGNETHDLLIANFTTTGPTERAATEIVMMNAFKEYFKYVVLTLCGIPEITLKGTTNDWRQVREKAQKLAQFELDWWTDPLVKILDMFVAASQGNVDKQFWSSFYKERESYVSYSINGWIVNLFPYIYINGELAKNNFLDKWNSDIKESDTSYYNSIEIDLIPLGVTKAPFTWNYYDILFPMHFNAGFMGTKQDPTTLTVSPVIGWSVADAQIEKDKEELETRRILGYHNV